MKSFITAIGTAVPSHKIDQRLAAGWMADFLNINGSGRKLLNTIYSTSGISSRYSVLEDYVKAKGTFSFYANSTDDTHPPVSKRMALYRSHALPLSLQAVRNMEEEADKAALQQVSHLIVVSCTGMYAPGLDIELIEELGLNADVERTSIQFMGCYAAFNALKTADYICRARPDAKVLCICVELCSLHLQPGNSRDALVANAIFSDGAVAFLMQGEPAKTGVSLSPSSFHCTLATHGKKEMAWHVGDQGFEMVLSSYVPKVIKGGIREMTQRLLDRLGMQRNDIHHFAIHPGGRRILEVCEEELELTERDNRHSYKVLENYGNMSSCTVVFVWKELLRNLKPEDQDKNILSFAFGPGLTMESTLLKIHYA